jgi:hypothetical protein
VISLKASTNEGNSEQVEIDKLPDHCPLCHYGIKVLFLNFAHLIKGFDGRLEIVLRCPREECQSLFIARYHLSRYPGANFYTYYGSAPFKHADLNFSESIRKISPDFCQIANQARNAEDEEWKLVAGPGYRKALEFLIKDYLCRLRPGEQESIKSMQLAACIAKYVTNDRIKATAARATWLGNDETHYVRKWEDKDLEDLKKLIQLTVHWIEMEELTDIAIREMPEGKK